jgi:hypothetical protein
MKGRQVYCCGGADDKRLRVVEGDDDRLVVSIEVRARRGASTHTCEVEISCANAMEFCLALDRWTRT